jgi:hypothetical protein
VERAAQPVDRHDVQLCVSWRLRGLGQPFYAAYLSATGISHPMAAEVIAAGEPDPAKVAAACLGKIPQSQSLFYQKHMTLHMIPEFERGFMLGLTNVFLIRHPARVVASYSKKRESPTLLDLGYVQQANLFHQVADWHGEAPIVVDSYDVRAKPLETLTKLCAALKIPFNSKMLRWPAGPKPYDGVWAPHWYNAVHQSTGLDEPEGPMPDLTPEFQKLADQAQPYYDRLATFALK